MNAIQLNFFESEETIINHQLRDQVKQLKASNDKIRKSLFAKNGEMQKKYDDLLARLEILERHICNG